MLYKWRIFPILQEGEKNVTCEASIQSSYSQYKDLLIEIQFDMLSQLNVSYLNVVTDSNVTINNEVFLPMDDHHYQVQFDMRGNGSTRTTFSNSTFKNMYLHLDSSRNPLIIKDNIFIGSSIKIIKESKDSSMVIMENNAFQGDYERSLVEIWNTENVSLKNNHFANVESVNYYSGDDKLSSGILCISSQIKLHDSSFKHINVDVIINFENCSVEMSNVSVSENTPTFLSGFGAEPTAIKMRNTNGKLDNMMFSDNKKLMFIHVQSGGVWLENITLMEMR